MGNGVLAIGGFQYMLQSAFGQLRLHVIGSTISAVIQVPIIFWAAINYGAIGAGMAWFSFRVIWFLWWTPIVHSKFVPGFHWKWMFKDILPVLTVIAFIAWLLSQQFGLSLESNRLLLFAEMGALGMALLALSALSVPIIRSKLLQKIRIIKNRVYK
ncbi:MAG: hypothetical protein COW40_11195 [Cytophagales bacterium CG17_big_fil_post_rev_8_21_14_2_50_40_13]|nr:MAG: hypothetical protein COW40_11195 [Cytophagales bacterium CG17_big_fil_post_rev_8_21_14_2_50_40_13]